jgi:hypothetical protein
MYGTLLLVIKVCQVSKGVEFKANNCMETNFAG